MNHKIISEIKGIAQEIDNSTNLDVSVLKNKISKLYDKLTILEFLEDSIDRVVEDKVIENKEKSTEDRPIVQKLETESIIDSIDFSENFEADSKKDETVNEVENTAVEETNSDKKIEEKEEVLFEKKIEEVESPTPSKSLHETFDTKKASLHEELKKNTIQIGLNDRIAFVKRLFDGNQQDFHRVLSQVNTFSDIDEVREFIDTMVKPEHNWDLHEEYADRFMGIIEAKFA